MHLGVAWQLADDQRYDEGRSHFDAACQLDRTETGQLGILVRRAVFERKAGRAEVADQLQAEAFALRPEPTFVLMSLLIESVRYKLPASVSAELEADWQKQLAKKCSSQAGGEMAVRMCKQISAIRPYEGIERHAEFVLDYLSRAGRVKFSREQLRSVCEFYQIAYAKLKLKLKRDLLADLKKSATRGVKQFPDDPSFPLHLSDVEFERPPGRVNFKKIETLLNDALRLALAKPDLTPPGMLKEIRSRLEIVEEMMPPPFFGFGGFGGGESGSASEAASFFGASPFEDSTFPAIPFGGLPGMPFGNMPGGAGMFGMLDSLKAMMQAEGISPDDFMRMIGEQSNDAGDDSKKSGGKKKKNSR